MFKDINMIKKILAVLAVMSILIFSAIHLSCGSDLGSLCVFSACAFTLTSAAIPLIISASSMMVLSPINQGRSFRFRLERPPRA